MDSEHPEGEEGFVKKKKSQKKYEVEEAKVTITSLMDIMTILLVFLMVSITSDPLNIQQNDDLTLAKSTAQTKPKDSIPVTINKRAVLADQALVAEVACKLGAQRCRQEDRDRRVACRQPGAVCDPDELKRLDQMYFYIEDRFKEDGSDKSFLIEPLFKELEKLVKQQKQENEALGRTFAGTATMVCDKDIPFRLLTEAVYSAGRAGLFDIRFAIIKSGQR